MTDKDRIIERLAGALLIAGAIVDDEINCPGNDRRSTVRTVVTDLIREAWCQVHDNDLTDRADPDRTDNPPPESIKTRGGYVDPEQILKALGISGDDWNVMLYRARNERNPPESR